MDNVIDRTTAGEGGFTNEPAFPNDNAFPIPATPGDHAPAQASEPAPPSGNDVEQYYDIGDNAGEDISSATAALPEQAYAKPLDSPAPSALGPGMSQRG